MEQSSEMSSDKRNPVQSDTTIISIMGLLCGSQQIVIPCRLRAVRFLTSENTVSERGGVLNFISCLLKVVL